MSTTEKKSLERTMQIDRSSIDAQMREVGTGGRKRPCFVILGGLDVGNIVSIEKNEIVIGRDPSCDIILRDDGISRTHCEIQIRPDETMLVRDLNSTNGTFVHGEQIREAILQDGDKVLLGRRTILKYALQDDLDKDFQQKIYESSTRDALTQAYNRKYFSQKIAADLSFARRHWVPFSLLMLDIDFFKKVNDTYGHVTGDQVLVAVAKAIAGSIRAEDLLARYGGEEFAVIAQGTNLQGGATLAERIRARVAAVTVPLPGGSGATLGVTVSVGLATLAPGAEAEPEDVVAAADKNLYAAKHGGRNRVVASEIAAAKPTERR